MSSALPPPPPPFTISRRAQAHAITASFLGWTLDAFDFFILVFMMDRVAADFHVDKAAIVATLTGTLALRPVGALIFGMLADRYGRRRPLIANVICFSLVELCCGFAPNYTVFLLLRCLYGIGMGGEWGVGASLAMEIAPQGRRGMLSGILQSGYSIGYLLAAVAAWAILPHFAPHLGWRVMFWSGGLPALLAFYIRTRVPESEAWKQHRAPSVSALLRTLAGHGKTFAYLVGLMTLMMFLSHGTQDLYPDFLHEVHKFSQGTVSSIAIFYNVGAVLGAVIFGHFSEKGRRQSMIAALALSLVLIPLWAFGRGAAWLALGAFLMQVGVQGAWGVIPAHLNELAPDSARGLMPGLSYQLGILFAAPVNSIEYYLRDRLGYPSALALFETVVIVSLAAALLLGHEQRGRSFFHQAGSPASAP
ncbi:MAG TPA: MFS transporter [Terriglobales bacterium]|nr:MFS transporter [Terriglobales bacterium]